MHLINLDVVMETATKTEAEIVIRTTAQGRDDSRINCLPEKYQYCCTGGLG